MARCPAARDDTTASLSLRDADGKVLAHCHARCERSSWEFIGDLPADQEIAEGVARLAAELDLDSIQERSLPTPHVRLLGERLRAKTNARSAPARLRYHLAQALKALDQIDGRQGRAA